MKNKKVRKPKNIVVQDYVFTISHYKDLEIVPDFGVIRYMHDVTVAEALRLSKWFSRLADWLDEENK